MKLLKAKYHINLQIPVKVNEVPLDDLLLSAESKWLSKRMPKFNESADKVGIIFPIIYTDFDSYWKKERWPKDDEGEYLKGYIVHTGNKRVVWARENGYTHIEGYYVDNKDDQATIIKRTYLPKQNWHTDPKRVEKMGVRGYIL